MRAQIIKQVTLTLSIQQAAWLMTVMQNPLNGDPDPVNEESGEKQMREQFFFALHNELEADRRGRREKELNEVLK